VHLIGSENGGTSLAVTFPLVSEPAAQPASQMAGEADTV